METFPAAVKSEHGVDEFPAEFSHSSFEARHAIGETTRSNSHIREYYTPDSINKNDFVDADDDEIVREIDVYISPTLTQQLHLIQFPLTPAAASTDHHHAPRSATTARYKPRNQLLELDFPVAHDSFATQKRANGIPYGLDLKQRTYTSHSIDPTTHTALGLVSSNGTSIHLIPLVHPVQQMRPSFKHIDDVNAEREGGDSGILQEEVPAGEPGEQPILLKKKESDKTIAIRQSSYAYKKALQAAEEWIDLQVQTERTHKNAVENKRREAYCSQIKRGLRLAPGASGGKKDYISTLNYLPVSLEDVDRISSSSISAPSDRTNDENEHAAVNLDDEGVGNRQGEEDELLRELTAKLTTSLQRGVPIPFSMIHHRYQNIEPLVILKALLGCSVLVRGNFVIKSTLSGLTPTEQDARDAIILLLNKYGFVQRYKLLLWVKTTALNTNERNERNADMEKNAGPTERSSNGIISRQADDLDSDATCYSLLKEESLNHIITSLCRKVENGWECKLEDDGMLALNFPLVAIAYNNYWALRTSQLQKYVDLYERLEQT